VHNHPPLPELLDISFSSVGRAVAYNARGPSIAKSIGQHKTRYKLLVEKGSKTTRH